MRNAPNRILANTMTDRAPRPGGRPCGSEIQVESSFKTRAVAMVASVATTFVLFQSVALIGHPAHAPVIAANACTTGYGVAS